MKYLTFCLLIVLLTVSVSCSKEWQKGKEKQKEETTCIQPSDDYGYLEDYENGSLCTSELCQKYQTIWKELFMKRNNISESYFKKHIILVRSDTSLWNQGISFSICYKIKIDWAIAWTCDQFIIKIKKSNKFYPALEIPRDKFLSKKSIEIAIDNRAFASKILTLSNDGILKFNSNASALKKLKSKSSVTNLCFSSVVINQGNGHISLKAYAEYVNKNNLCIIGTIDLINGKTSFFKTACRIY